MLVNTESKMETVMVDTDSTNRILTLGMTAEERIQIIV